LLLGHKRDNFYSLNKLKKLKLEYCCLLHKTKPYFTAKEAYHAIKLQHKATFFETQPLSTSMIIVYITVQILWIKWNELMYKLETMETTQALFL
jgi:hypothetical protein